MVVGNFARISQVVGLMLLVIAGNASAEQEYYLTPGEIRQIPGAVQDLEQDAEAWKRFMRESSDQPSQFSSPAEAVRVLRSLDGEARTLIRLAHSYRRHRDRLEHGVSALTRVARTAKLHSGPMRQAHIRGLRALWALVEGSSDSDLEHEIVPLILISMDARIENQARLGRRAQNVLLALEQKAAVLESIRVGLRGRIERAREALRAIRHGIVASG